MKSFVEKYEKLFWRLLQQSVSFSNQMISELGGHSQRQILYGQIRELRFEVRKYFVTCKLWDILTKVSHKVHFSHFDNYANTSKKKSFVSGTNHLLLVGVSQITPSSSKTVGQINSASNAVVYNAFLYVSTMVLSQANDQELAANWQKRQDSRLYLLSCTGWLRAYTAHSACISHCGPHSEGITEHGLQKLPFGISSDFYGTTHFHQ